MTVSQQSAQTSFLDICIRVSQKSFVHFVSFFVENCLTIMRGMNNRKYDTRLLLVYTNFAQKIFYYLN